MNSGARRRASVINDTPRTRPSPGSRIATVRWQCALTLGIFSGTGPEMNSGSRRRTPVIGSGTRQPAVQELPVVVAQRPPVVDEEEEEGCPVLVTHPIRAGGRCQDYRLETEARDRRL